MTVTLYSKPACVQCRQTEKTFAANGVAFSKIDVTEDANAYQFVTGELGYRAAPVVAIRDENGNVVDSWSGFNLEKIAALAV
jgi:glutaredoxin-like protein NrdH